MRERVQFGLALLLDLAGAGAALLVATRTWQRVVTPRPRPFRDDILDVSGRTLDHAPTALALVALAGVIALLATRGWPRRVVGLVVATAGAGLVWRSLADVAAVGTARARELVLAAHPGVQIGVASPRVHAHPSWAVLSALCGVAVVAAGVLIAWRGHRWGAMSARYDRPVMDTVGTAGTTAGPDSSITEPEGTDGMDDEDAQRARSRADAALWRALDRGDDPTDSAG